MKANTSLAECNCFSFDGLLSKVNSYEPSQPPKKLNVKQPLSDLGLLINKKTSTEGIHRLITFYFLMHRFFDQKAKSAAE